MRAAQGHFTCLDNVIRYCENLFKEKGLILVQDNDTPPREKPDWG